MTSELTSKWITFKVLIQTLPNSQGRCLNTSRWGLQNYMVNGWELTSELTSKWITFKVLIQTLPNSQGRCLNTSRWGLQNYMVNGWGLTSELTSKWITFKNTQSNFTLISLITFEVFNQTLPNLQGTCRNTSRWCLQNYTGNGWELTSELSSKWITFEILNQISH